MFLWCSSLCLLFCMCFEKVGLESIVRPSIFVFVCGSVVLIIVCLSFVE